MHPLLLLHMLAGLVGITAGFGALFIGKGTARHRLVGLTFVISMALMSLCGAYLSFIHQPVKVNVIAGLLTFYLVVSGWLTARKPSARTRGAEWALMFMAVLVVVAALHFRTQLGSSADDEENDGAYVAFAGIAFFCVALDLSLYWRGRLTGAKRLARHLWRMNLALLIATFSLLFGTPNRILPAIIRDSGWRWLPVLVIGVMLIFWWCRVFMARKYRDAAAARNL